MNIIEDEKELDIALPPIAIKPLSGFYDFKNKYQAGLTEEICSADIIQEWIS